MVHVVHGTNGTFRFSLFSFQGFLLYLYIIYIIIYIIYNNIDILIFPFSPFSDFPYVPFVPCTICTINSAFPTMTAEECHLEPPTCHLERSREISPCASLSRDDNPIIITSGYRSPEVNKAVGGSPTSNHLTGCAVDIRCAGIERSKQGHYWIHFAARPTDNRRKTAFIQT